MASPAKKLETITLQQGKIKLELNEQRNMLEQMAAKVDTLEQ